MKKPTIRKILVPVDFSKMSDDSIEIGKHLAHCNGATVHLAHAYHLEYPAGFMAPMPPLMPFSLATCEEDAEKKLAHQLTALAETHGLARTNCHLLCGAPAFDEICRLAKELPADLIVMPTHGRTGLKHVFLGSTAERVVQHSTCPVFVMRRNKRRRSKTAPGSINTILVPVDFSKCSVRGLQYAIAFADRFAAKLILVHAVQTGYPYTADGYAMYDFSVITKALRKDAEREMQRLVRRTKFGQVHFETTIVTGQPASATCELARRRGVDLIIASTHGWTGIKHMLLGSTAEQIARYAPCSVLIAPSHPTARASHLSRSASPSMARPDRLAGNGARQRRAEVPKFTRRSRKLAAYAFPERRKTNRFRESHPHRRLLY